MFDGVQCLGLEVVELCRNPSLPPDAFTVRFLLLEVEVIASDRALERRSPMPIPLRYVCIYLSLRQTAKKDTRVWI